MSGRLYRCTASFTLTAAGGDADLLSWAPAANKPVALVGFRVGQTSEVGDAAEENIRITLRHMAATVTPGSGGASVTPEPCGSVNSAAAFTSRANDATVATTSGASVIKENIGWNERNSPAELWWPEESMQLTTINGELMLIRCETTVADDIALLVTAFLREMP